MRLSRHNFSKWSAWLANHAPICQICGRTKAVEAHHVLYGAYKDDSTLISVCRPCHMWCHANKKESQKYWGLAKKNWETYQGSVNE